MREPYIPETGQPEDFRVPAAWKVEGGHYKFLRAKGFRVRQVPAWRATNGESDTQLTSVESEAQAWADALNKGHRPFAANLQPRAA